MFSSLAAVASLAILPVALAQSTIDVQVGPSGTLAYVPPSVTAAAGDIIRFTFNPKNHTVTQSSFNEPCVPLPGGASSGFQPVSNVSGLLPTWTFTVANSSSPLWFFCEQTGHCGKGMVFAINAPADPNPHSFSAFQELAEELNGTTTSVATATTPPPQSWASATATVTHAGSTWTTVYTSYDGTPQPTYAASPVDHVITVGEDGLTFTPANISASIGDTVTFQFHPKNHTVTQSSFSNPCVPLAKTSTTGQVGFNSGFNFPVSPNSTDFPTFQITVNDTAPIWGFCEQTGHCEQGMVFSINAVEDGPNNFAAFRQLALNTNPSAAIASGGGSGTTSGSAAGASTSGNAASVGSTPSLLLGLVGGLLALL
ncbi:hypothetical protein HMN09_01291900 [Mycena chlorophos]|uniref:Cupredoxin n=1 Tax=Mycena chlorophos TaxID=658473 RepID=A0A8H6VQU8_MYCCL|nr:hypothetical protein HMN09_01291900 [Mycena chlorophos]